MKIVCQSCGAKYAIADDKVKGKVFKIRCKKCNEAIVVKGIDEDDDDLAGNSEPSTLEEENEGATKVFDYSNYAASSSAAEKAIWHVVVEGEQRGPFTMEQLHHFQEAGTVVPETYVWREGFEEWKPLYSVPEFGAAPAPADNLFAAEPAPVGGGGLFDSPSSGGDGLFDAGRGLFDGGGDRGASPFGAVSSGLFDGGDASTGKGEVFSSTGASGAKDDLFPGFDGGGGPMDGLAPAMTGARNESSVLFSLSNLQALASSSAGPTARSGGAATPAATVPSTSEASGLIDIRSLASALSDEGKKDSSGVDDFLSFGGGGFGPALGAPVLAAVRPGMSTGLKIAIVAGGVVLLATLLTLALMLTRGKESSSSESNEQIAMLLAKIQEMEKSGASEEDKAKARAELADAQSSKTGEDKAEAEPAKEASKDGQPQEDKKPEKQARASAGGASKKADAGASKASTRDDGGDKARASAAATPTPSASGGGAKTKASSELDELLGGGAPAKPAAAKPAAEPKAASSSGGDMLTREQVQSGLNSVAPAVKRCAQGESGTITIQVVISPSGSVSSATPMGAYAGTPIGSCAARAVRTARFARSSKELTVKYPFKL